jgi:hypothetical protein
MSFLGDGIIDFWKGFAFGVKLYIKCSFALVLDGGDGDARLSRWRGEACLTNFFE